MTNDPIYPVFVVKQKSASLVNNILCILLRINLLGRGWRGGGVEVELCVSVLIPKRENLEASNVDCLRLQQKHHPDFVSFLL